MPLLTLDRVCLAFGLQPLLDHVSLAIQEGEKIALVGRNGEGKSTLLRILAGALIPDSGEIIRQDGLVTGFLDQQLPEPTVETVYDVIASGLPHCAALLAEYHALAHAEMTDAAITRLSHLHQALDNADAWSLGQRVDQVISRLDLDPDALMKDLSGGWRRRVLLGRALVSQPQLLLLDEPTNHLDIPAIEWLEDFIAGYRGTIVVVTHDRRFLGHVVNRVVELDRGKVFSLTGSYDNYLANREKRLEDEARAEALFDRRLAEEEIWIRQGIKARRTRNEGRVRALKALRRERAERRQHQGVVNMALDSSVKSGRLVLEARAVQFGYDPTRPVIRDFSYVMMRGDRVGILGGNGAGKSTLIRLMLGHLRPDSGTVTLGSNLQVAYFDQLRELLDPSKSVQDNIAEGRDFIEINGKRKHIIGYLGDFLFAPQRCRTPVSALSGGERNRLMLARLFCKPANLLVMDEPTNDLDMETLEMLEELLCDYQGSLIVVSHDREFLEQVVTTTLAFEGDGRVAEYVGGFDDWMRQGKGFVDARQSRPTSQGSGASPSSVPAAKASADLNDMANTSRKADASPSSDAGNSPAGASGGASTATNSAKPAKLSYKLQRELESLPALIESLEQRIAGLQASVSDPAFYQQAAPVVNAALRELAEQEALLERSLERWLDLEAGKGK